MSSTRLVLFGFVLVLSEQFGASGFFNLWPAPVIKESSEETVVAFQATLTTGQIGPNYGDGAIKFNDVSFNIGNGYDPSTGKFTAPVEGLYQFNVAYLQANGYTSHVRLVKDTSVYSDLHANHKNYDVISKTVLVILEKEEIFYAKLEKSSDYAVHGSSRYTQFSGLLVSTTVE